MDLSFIKKENFIQQHTETGFNELALQVFHFQAEANPVYRDYLQYAGKKPQEIRTVSEIPFLPVEFFKSHKVISSKEKADLMFSSSSTTGMQPSKHYVVDPGWYESSFMSGFKLFYGNPEEMCVLALLPSYLEREGSSLIYMMNHLIRESKHPFSGFYLHNTDELIEKLRELEEKKQKTLLMGVSFALLDLAEQYQLQLQHTIVMETGGMKGQRKEITRGALHGFLCKRLGVSEIHSEYGMTELLSQAYSGGHGRYRTPPWMRILIRDLYDPFSLVEKNRTGGVNIIDLANVWSCAFIETKDLGLLHQDGSFEISGRFDHSDTRGCNLLVV
ncbi:MAG TPA: acyltransferase [Bacteroidales bacterium]|nr:acyltransferase [Bacteroidales bacterium]